MDNKLAVGPINCCRLSTGNVHSALNSLSLGIEAHGHVTSTRHYNSDTAAEQQSHSINRQQESLAAACLLALLSQTSFMVKAPSAGQLYSAWRHSISWPPRWNRHYLHSLPGVLHLQKRDAFCRPPTSWTAKQAPGSPWQAYTCRPLSVHLTTDRVAVKKHRLFVRSARTLLRWNFGAGDPQTGRLWEGELSAASH